MEEQQSRINGGTTVSYLCMNNSLQSMEELVSYQWRNNSPLSMEEP